MDLSLSSNDAQFREIHDALMENLVIFFRQFRDVRQVFPEARGECRRNGTDLTNIPCTYSRLSEQCRSLGSGSDLLRGHPGVFGFLGLLFPGEMVALIAGALAATQAFSPWVGLRNSRERRGPRRCRGLFDGPPLGTVAPGPMVLRATSVRATSRPTGILFRAMGRRDRTHRPFHRRGPRLRAICCRSVRDACPSLHSDGSARGCALGWSGRCSRICAWLQLATRRTMDEIAWRWNCYSIRLDHPDGPVVAMAFKATESNRRSVAAPRSAIRNRPHPFFRVLSGSPQSSRCVLDGARFSPSIRSISTDI
jgi:hypothetical protein